MKFLIMELILWSGFSISAYQNKVEWCIVVGLLLLYEQSERHYKGKP